MALAESRESGNQIAEAADYYKKAAAEASGKPFIEQTARFRQAQLIAQLALGDPNRNAEAVALLDAAIKAYPNSRHIVAALDTLARLQIQKGDFAAVEKTIAAMSRLPRRRPRRGPARQTLRQAGPARPGDRRVRPPDPGVAEGSTRRLEARLARAESLVGLKKFAEAEADVRAVIKASPAEDDQAQSAAYNTLGDCLRAAGKPKDALLAYLHTDLLYSKDKEQHPRALANIAKLLPRAQGDDRADEAVTRLSQDYPRSPWLAAARSTAP